MEENKNIEIEKLRKEIDVLLKICERATGGEKKKALSVLQSKQMEMVALNKISDPMYNILGKRLREMRESLRMSQTVVAESVGLKQLAVMNYENGKRYPDAETLRGFARLYGCTSDYLLGLSDFPTKEEYDSFTCSIAALDEIVEQLKLTNHRDFIQTLANYLDKSTKLYTSSVNDIPVEQAVDHIAFLQTLIYALTEVLNVLKLLKDKSENAVEIRGAYSLLGAVSSLHDKQDDIDLLLKKHFKEISKEILSDIGLSTLKSAIEEVYPDDNNKE